MIARVVEAKALVTGARCCQGTTVTHIGDGVVGIRDLQATWVVAFAKGCALLRVHVGQPRRSAPSRHRARGVSPEQVASINDLVAKHLELVDAVFVDDVDEGSEVAAGGVVLGVVLHFATGGGEHQFGVGGAAAVFEVPGGQGEVLECLPSPTRATVVGRRVGQGSRSWRRRWCGT
jgi:hypothetical protein